MWMWKVSYFLEKNENVYSLCWTKIKLKMIKNGKKVILQIKWQNCKVKMVVNALSK